MFKHIKIYEREEVLYFDLLLNESLKEAVKVKGRDAFVGFVARKGDAYKRLRFSSTLRIQARDFLERNKEDLIQHYILHGNKDFKKLYETGVGDELSLKYYANLLLRTSSGLKRSTQINLRSIAEYNCAFFGNLNIKSINKNDILRFYEHLEQNKKIRTIKSYISVLKRLFELAIENEVISKNPVFYKKYSKDKESERKYPLEPFSEAEFFTLLKQKGDIGLYLKIALLTGARTGEILALKFGDFDFENSKLTINKAHSKFNGLSSPKTSNSTRCIDLLPTLAKFIKAEMEKREADAETLIFTNTRGEPIFQFHNSQLDREYKSLLNALNIKPRRVYNTRHSFASLMLSKNEPPLWVSFMLGHKNTQITFSKYAKYLPIESQKHAEFINEALQKEEANA